jgi:hypothetical protein
MRTLLIYRDPADVPEENRNHSSLARLIRKRSRDGRPLLDEEGETRRPDAHLTPAMKPRRVLLPIYAVRF